MSHKNIVMEHDKKLALIAYNHKKRDLVEWAKFNRTLLAHHRIYATGTTGTLLEQELRFEITKLQSGPLGGDQQIGAMIADGEIDFMISSPLMDGEYDHLVPDYEEYRTPNLDPNGRDAGGF
jgi:methylglyoxal synthase